MQRAHVLLVLFCLLAFAFASRQRIEDQCGDIIEELPEGVSGSLTYYFPPLGFVPPPNGVDGGPGTVNCTYGESPRCTQVINTDFLQGRTWYITQDKAYFGQGFNPWTFQTYKLQCPLGHYLSLAPIGDLRLDCGEDSVRINTSRGDTGRLCTQQDVIDTGDMFYNGGRGIIVQDGKASVEFCSSSGLMNFGYIIRATCFLPSLDYNNPGCVSYQFFRAWDPDFVNDILRPFDEVNTTIVPHKRSVEEQAQMHENMKTKMEELKRGDIQMRQEVARDKMLSRSKRGVRYLFNFPEGTTITYVNNHLMFTFPNGTRREFFVTCLTAFNEFFGTRVYRTNATRQSGDTTGATRITFTGPGRVDIIPNSDRSGVPATMSWTPPLPFDEYLEDEGQEQQMIAATIYRYIAEEWFDPYPVLDRLLEGFLRPKPYPVTGPQGQNFPKSVRTRNQVGIVFPQISEDSLCEEGIRFDDAPLQSARIDPDILEFCSFFQFACEPILKTVCREIMFLDPFDVDPLSRMQMMGGGD